MVGSRCNRVLFCFLISGVANTPLCVECFVVRNAVLEGAALQALWR